MFHKHQQTHSSPPTDLDKQLIVQEHLKKVQVTNSSIMIHSTLMQLVPQPFRSTCHYKYIKMSKGWNCNSLKYVW